MSSTEGLTATCTAVFECAVCDLCCLVTDGRYKMDEEDSDQLNVQAHTVLHVKKSEGESEQQEL